MQMRMTRSDLGFRLADSRGWGCDDTMVYARTNYGVRWNGQFDAPCPHGQTVVWVSVPMKAAVPICSCTEASG